MSARFPLYIGVLGCVGLLVGCEGGLAVNYYEADPPRVVHVDHGHLCGPGCDHFYDGTRYVVLRGHRHGPGCGHFLEGSRWMVVVRTPGGGHGDHICGPGCHDHYWDGGKIVVIRDKHRHGPSCGHHFDGNHWVIAVSRDRPGPDRVVRIPAPPGEAKFYVYDRRGSKWLKVAKGHTHGPKCGHVVVEGHWCNP